MADDVRTEPDGSELGTPTDAPEPGDLEEMTRARSRKRRFARRA
jgi:hypothetical protein